MVTSITNNEAVGLVQLFTEACEHPHPSRENARISASVNTIAEDPGESRAMTEQEVRATIKAFMPLHGANKPVFKALNSTEHMATSSLNFLANLRTRRDDDWGGDGRRRQRFLGGHRASRS